MDTNKNWSGVEKRIEEAKEMIEAFLREARNRQGELLMAYKPLYDLLQSEIMQDPEALEFALYLFEGAIRPYRFLVLLRLLKTYLDSCKCDLKSFVDALHANNITLDDLLSLIEYEKCRSKR